MRRSIRLWLDWAMTDLFKLASRRPTEQHVHLRYEKAGQTVYEPTIPWNADAVLIEVLANLPPVARTRTDFIVRLPGEEPIPAEAVRKDRGDDSAHRISFRLPYIPKSSLTVDILWKNRLLASVPITVQTSTQFLDGLRLSTPTVSVRLANQSVAARTFVASQCKGLFAAAVLRSTTPLAPVQDAGLKVVFRSERGGVDHPVAVPLSGTQMTSREALISASPLKPPKRSGTYSVSWMLGERELHSQKLTAITMLRFLQSLRISDARFVIAGKNGPPRAIRTLPPIGEYQRIGPCFILASKEVGIAGLLPVQVVAIVPGAVQPPVLFEQTLLITDGPLLFAPGLINVEDLGTATGFELRHNGKVLGTLSLSPVPSATFTAEGGFKPPPDFSWTSLAEDELNERLGKLFGN